MHLDDIRVLWNALKRLAHHRDMHNEVQQY